MFNCVRQITRVLDQINEKIREYIAETIVVDNRSTEKNEHKSELLDKISHISTMANIYYVRQNMPLGLGHAILKAKSFIGDDPFVIVLGDDIIYNPEKPVTKQMIEKYEFYEKSIIGCQEVAKGDISKYGIAKLGNEFDETTFEMLDFLEKPSIEDAPSRMACLGRYLLSGKIFKYLEETKPGKIVKFN